MCNCKFCSHVWIKIYTPLMCRHGHHSHSKCTSNTCCFLLCVFFLNKTLKNLFHYKKNGFFSLKNLLVFFDSIFDTRTGWMHVFTKVCTVLVQWQAANVFCFLVCKRQARIHVYTHKRVFGLLTPSTNNTICCMNSVLKLNFFLCSVFFVNIFQFVFIFWEHSYSCLWWIEISRFLSKIKLKKSNERKKFIQGWIDKTETDETN